MGQRVHGVQPPKRGHHRRRHLCPGDALPQRQGTALRRLRRFRWQPEERLD